MDLTARIRQHFEDSAQLKRDAAKALAPTIAQAANAITSTPTMTALASGPRVPAKRSTHGEITIQMPSRMLTPSSHGLGIDTAIAANTTMATPRTHAFHAAVASMCA